VENKKSGNSKMAYYAYSLLARLLSCKGLFRSRLPTTLQNVVSGKSGQKNMNDALQIPDNKCG
jgi:hypothetical protein